MRSKFVIMSLLFVLITPVIGSFYMTLHKANKKKVTLSVVTEEEEEEGHSNEKFGKEKHSVNYSSISFILIENKQLKYIHISEKELLSCTDCLTPPPKIS